MPPCLRAHECRVFIVPLAAMAASLLELRAVLSSEERRRADGFHFARDAAMFAVIHGVLRHLLARLLATAPEAVGFTVQPGGKPALAPGFSDSLRFNISHSRSYAAVALARNFELGVDIEDVRPMDDMQELARDCLHPWEAECIEAASGAGRCPAAVLRHLDAEGGGFEGPGRGSAHSSAQLQGARRSQRLGKSSRFCPPERPPVCVGPAEQGLDGGCGPGPAGIRVFVQITLPRLLLQGQLRPLPLAGRLDCSRTSCRTMPLFPGHLQRSLFSGCLSVQLVSKFWRQGVFYSWRAYAGL